MTILVGRDIRSGWDDLAIYPVLHQLATGWKTEPQLFQTVVALFADSAPLTEREYEACLWTRIQSLSDKDVWLGQEPDPRVSSNPSDPHFSLSFAGEAFFVVALHDQFEMLRAQGRYEKLRSAILERDVALAGSVNPMLARHGSVSEARQYSGRVVEDDWQPPFVGRRDFSDAA